MRKRSRSDLFAALVALTDAQEGLESPEPGFKTAKQFEADFGLGSKQTYVWLEKLYDAGLCLKRSFRIRLGAARREVPHYRLGEKAAAIVKEIKGGRKPRGEA